MQTLQQNRNLLPSLMQRRSASTINATARNILHTLFKNYHGPVSIRYDDGNRPQQTNTGRCTIHIRHPGVIRELILKRDLSRLAEAYIAGFLDVSGDIEDIFTLEKYFSTLSIDTGTRIKLLANALRLPRLSNISYDRRVRAGASQQQNSRHTIAHHYDVGNDFYRLWLDRNMVYSCAYFKHPDQNIDQAQQDKLDYLCKKLRLRAGMTLLDIGCGWGALAIWAATHYGVRVHGITLSQQQYDEAHHRVRDAGLERQIQIELRDYRDLDESMQYDRIVSVGMFEHIGVKNFPLYFGKVKKLLKLGGLFLNHGITIKQNLRRSPLKRFINQYIFPDGELARISDVNDAMERAGFEILDVESLRQHYALTLRKWVARLQQHFDQASANSSIEMVRLWQLYMAGFAYYFDEGTVNVHQILVAHQHDTLPTPLRRDDIYNQSGQPAGR